MKRWIIALAALIMCASTIKAQNVNEQQEPTEEYAIRPQFGVIHYDSLLQAMPEYAEAMQQYALLKEKYAQEVSYNEQEFKRQFANFLAGQKSFTKVIMLKRQSDLQNAMERQLAFRAKTDSLLQEAKDKMLAPIHIKLKKAIQMAGEERSYAFIANLDDNTLPFVNALLGEDATPFVQENLNRLVIRQRQSK